MDYEQIFYELREDVALITLNRPERRNAWTPQIRARASLAARP